MAHALDITDGKASFASANVAAWHQLGTVFDGKMTAQEALDAANLSGWNVRKSPMETTVGGKKIVVPGMYLTVRDNPVRKGQVDVLGKYPVSEGYKHIQNEDHVAFLDTLVDESGAHFETAGALHGGSQIFVTMKLPGHIMVGGVDPVENYIAAMNSHDGSMSFTGMITPVRVVCANTQNMAFQNNSHIFRIRHTTNADRNIVAKAREALDISFKYLEAFQAEAEKLIQTTMTQARFEAIIAKEFGVAEDASPAARTRAEKRLDEMTKLFADAQTQEGIRGTAWAGLNALTEWADHFSGVRGEDADTSRAVKAIFDPSFKNEALKLMMATV